VLRTKRGMPRKPEAGVITRSRSLGYLSGVGGKPGGNAESKGQLVHYGKSAPVGQDLGRCRQLFFTQWKKRH